MKKFKIWFHLEVLIFIHKFDFNKSTTFSTFRYLPFLLFIALFVMFIHFPHIHPPVLPPMTSYISIYILLLRPSSSFFFLVRTTITMFNSSTVSSAAARCQAVKSSIQAREGKPCKVSACKCPNRCWGRSSPRKHRSLTLYK